MTIPLTINGATFNYPEIGDVDWGSAATAWASAVTSGMLQKAGGNFTLLADVNFGPNFGLLSQYFTSRTANPSSAGVLRLARADEIGFRNEANTADLALGVNSSDQLTFDGNVIQGSISVTDTATIDLTLAADVLSADIVNGSITNAMINASAAIAYSKLASIPAGQVLLGNSANVATPTALSGDITVNDTGVTAISSGVIVNADVNASAAIAGTKVDPTFGNQVIYGSRELQLAEIATPSGTPVAGTVKFYPKSDGNLYKQTPDGVEKQVGSAGAGELNLLPDSSIAGVTWENQGVTTVTTTTASELPLEGVIDTAIKLSGGSATQFSRARFSMPASLINTLLSINWYQLTNGYASGDYELELYTNDGANYSGSYTRVPLGNDNAGVSEIPNFEGQYSNNFVSNSEELYELRIVRTAGSGFISLANVVIGPGTTAQGAVVTAWEPYTPTLGGTTTNGSFTYATRQAISRRVGDSIEVIGSFGMTTVTTAPTGTLTVSLPSGLSINSTLALNTNGVKGNGRFFDVSSTSNIPVSVQYYSGDSPLTRVKIGQSSDIVVPALANSDQLHFHFVAPIAQFAGTGTVNLGQNDVEYAATSGTWDADSSTTIYGLDGAAIGGALTAQRTKTVSFSNVLPTDEITLELKINGTWINGGVRYPFTRQNTTFYGCTTNGPAAVSATQVRAIFAQYYSPDSGTFGAAGLSWNDLVGIGTRWRLKKTKAGAATGFGLLNGQNSGLMPANLSVLDDVAATRMGLKSYSHGTTYNAGIAPTITVVAGGSLSSVTSSFFIPYQMQDGSWRMRFSFYCIVALATRTTQTFNVNGVSISLTQAIAGYNFSGLSTVIAFVQSASGNFRIDHSSFSANQYALSGDVALSAKPTWAY